MILSMDSFFAQDEKSDEDDSPMPEVGPQNEHGEEEVK